MSPDGQPATGASPPAPIIVSARFDPPVQAWLDRLRRTHFPPERNHLAAHLTLFHHLPPSIGGELRGRLAALTRAAPPLARIAGLINLGRGTAIRIHSPALIAIRAELAEAFAPLLTPQDRAGWRPHVTIQNKVDPADARALNMALSATLEEEQTMIAAIETFFYRGGPWEQIARYPFREG